MVSSTPEERKMFRVTPMHYVVFDEAHMLKNMNTQRYETLVRIKVNFMLDIFINLHYSQLFFFIRPNIEYY